MESKSSLKLDLVLELGLNLNLVLQPKPEFLKNNFLEIIGLESRVNR
jgi:hypothetical protein